jgi:hypothetical protein
MWRNNETPNQQEEKMKSIELFMKQTILALCVIAAAFTSGFAAPVEGPVAEANPDYEIGTTEYSDLSVKSLSAWTQLDFDAWAATMSDDVEFYFPDGDAGTRTSLIGKAAVLKWWNNWKTTSGIQSMSYLNHVDIPVIAKVANPYTGLTGPLVISYFSNELVYGEGTVKVRMNVAMYFDSAKRINRFYTYYDRTGILEATGTNVLKE